MQAFQPSESARCAGVVLWDFDQYAGYHRNALITLFATTVKRLEADGVVRSRLDVHTIAFGLSRSFNVPGVTSALTNMCVEMRLVPDAEHEETDRQLERAAREYASDPAVEAIVILSSDELKGLVRDLRRANKRVYIVHNAPRGSQQETLLSLFATGTYHIEDLGCADMALVPKDAGTQLPKSPPPSYAESRQFRPPQCRPGVCRTATSSETPNVPSATHVQCTEVTRDNHNLQLGAAYGASTNHSPVVVNQLSRRTGHDSQEPNAHGASATQTKQPNAISVSHKASYAAVARHSCPSAVDTCHLDEQPIATGRNVHGGAPANAPSNTKPTLRVASSSQRSPPAAVHGHSGAALGSQAPPTYDRATASRTLSPAAGILLLREIFL